MTCELLQNGKHRGESACSRKAASGTNLHWEVIHITATLLLLLLVPPLDILISAILLLIIVILSRLGVVALLLLLASILAWPGGLLLPIVDGRTIGRCWPGVVDLQSGAML